MKKARIRVMWILAFFSSPFLIQIYIAAIHTVSVI